MVDELATRIPLPIPIIGPVIVAVSLPVVPAVAIAMECFAISSENPIALCSHRASVSEAYLPEDDRISLAQNIVPAHQ